MELEQEFHTPYATHSGTQDQDYGSNQYDILCFSHLRWDFVFQRPQHLLTRFARRRRVFYLEEPLRADVALPTLETEKRQDGVILATPHIPKSTPAHEVTAMTRKAVDALVERFHIRDFVSWYYTPMALPFTDHLRPIATIFDCMDELSGFAGAPAEMKAMEARLLGRADRVFTGGVSLYEAKKRHHPRVYPFPSSIDKEHFMAARGGSTDPADQAGIPHPRIGYHGVLDERLDIGLLRHAAAARPDWQWILIGPICKIDPADLPRAANIWYLGKKDYADLPRYLAHWDAAMMPFALNDATKFISPTKTPEYLAAGRPVVSTPIRDVVNPYGRDGLVEIAASPGQFVAACERAMALGRDPKWRAKVDRFLEGNSWDATWSRMNGMVESACRVSAGRAARHV